MPEISLIPQVLYTGNQPYHVHFDNLPLKNILARIDLVNAQVDINAGILRGSAGTVGNLANRLSVSIEQNGDLVVEAVDNALHNIAYHTDGEKDGIEYVRMTQDERDKLSLIESEANALNIEFELISTTSLFTTGTCRFIETDTVSYEFESPDKIKINTVFPAAAAHQHYYDVTPIHSIPSGPNYTDFETATSFVDGSLVVYVNGIRLSSTDSIRVPDADDVDTWTLTTVDFLDADAGEFSLNRALNSNDIIRIDYIRDFT